MARVRRLAPPRVAAFFREKNARLVHTVLTLAPRKAASYAPNPNIMLVDATFTVMSGRLAASIRIVSVAFTVNI
jgi:hypothetical protein